MHYPILNEAIESASAIISSYTGAGDLTTPEEVHHWYIVEGFVLSQIWPHDQPLRLTGVPQLTEEQATAVLQKITVLRTKLASAGAKALPWIQIALFFFDLIQKWINRQEPSYGRANRGADRGR